MKTITKTLYLSALTSCTLSLSLQANELPGKGITVQPVQSTIAEETFQTLLVNKAMEQLGYTVKPTQEVDYNVAYTSIANGDATYLAVNWDPQQKDKYQLGGGDDKFYREGIYVNNAAQGYLIDKKTADKYHINNLGQLKDPKIAKLFDSDGDGKADLTGGEPGWTTESIINHQIQAYGLQDTVTQRQGSYSALIADTISRYKNGESVLYYTWTPYWVSSILIPGKDVVWLQVPFSAMPKGLQQDTALPNGNNYGFQINTMRIVANKQFAQDNPAAAKLFSIMKLDIGDISQQNMMMRKGQNKPEDIEAHANAWIKSHQKQFDSWVNQAKSVIK
ncbi:glycine betaine/L-proline ABC transporter substrate-binding protein ProX [Vibrio aphrogenes]|uniref:glycine betaine/L-proline ABC transporter substrate-binding protein ProX n=1 Tax=Vibrio aphrogenes TaxID=1891186 RepID=UPI000B35ADFF|nr:glycine betaine/L-proline ABC transporter substrate-binding protein ProX [Vibrio aphrogenes]